jgi:glycosyltransferase involved in cell wall biosynthesis
MNARALKVVVVLGMHRSGTSALTRGLQALGVSLGDNLMPASEGNNSKGFWEDLEIVALNDAVLAELGLSWHSLGALRRDEDFSRLLDSPLACEAEAYLRRQLELHPCLGLKDPRMARLLPFWLVIFQRCQIEPFFLISCRDPLSVSRSLKKRDGFLLGKSAYLWLEHVLLALLYTADHQRLVVGFDQLLEQPIKELERIARIAGLPCPLPEALHSYQDSFLEAGLRHFKHDPHELEGHPDIAVEAIQLYRLLQQLAIDDVRLDQKVIRSKVNDVLARLSLDHPLYRLASTQDAVVTTLTKQLESQQQLQDQLSELQRAAMQQTAEAQQKLQDVSLALAEIQRSSSWRMTEPLRRSVAQWRKAKTLPIRVFTSFSKQLYYRLPAGIREYCLNFAYRYLGFLFTGMGHYETWRLSTTNDHRTEAYRYREPERTLEADRAMAQCLRQPLISIVTPVYGVELRYLQALIESVLQQWYPHWELILVEDAGPNLETRQFLRDIRDPRIKVILCERNGGISYASNLALAEATGEYVLFLDHDDELTADALYEVIIAINKYDPDYIYSDEDKIDDAGNISSPFYKPDWSPDTLMSIMYTCHLSCIRKSLVDEVGGLRSDFDGAQDYDLVLRIVERTARIHHIKKILYHWRTLPSSVAAGLNAKPYTADATRRLKEEALQRRALQGRVEAVEEMPGQYRVNYSCRGMPLVSIIIVSRDDAAALRRCVESILAVTRFINYEIIVAASQVDRLMLSNYFTEPANDARLELIQVSDEYSQALIKNLAAQASKGEYILFLSDLSEISQGDWLDRLLGFAQLKRLGAVGAKLVCPERRILKSCGMLNSEKGPVPAFSGAPAFSPLYNGRNILDWNCLSVSGACLMVARENFSAIQGFDESLETECADADLCWRLADLGLTSVVCNAVIIIQHDACIADSKATDTASEKDLFIKHPHRRGIDPYVGAGIKIGC